MKILSWNVNGLKSLFNNGFKQIIEKINADIICLQETKITKEMPNISLEGYYHYFNFTTKGGFSGVAIYTKKIPENIILGIEIENEDEEIENIDTESRVITLEYNDFFIVCVYVPCSSKLINKKIDRTEFDNYFCEYISKLNNIKDVIVCGDFNVCHQNIDICNLRIHENIDVFADDDRMNFNELLNIGLVDTYRYMHPQMRKYTFWTNDVENRENSTVGWRLDYILVSEYIRANIREANILTEFKGSDHCPIELIIKL